VSKARPRYDKLLTLPKTQRIAQREANASSLPARLSVGDYVKLRQLDDSTGLIEEILPRQSALLRKDPDVKAKSPIAQTMLANLDQVVIVFATTQPEPHFGMLDRYLAICESAQIRPIICINKSTWRMISAWRKQQTSIVAWATR